MNRLAILIRKIITPGNIVNCLLHQAICLVSAGVGSRCLQVIYLTVIELTVLLFMCLILELFSVGMNSMYSLVLISIL